MKKTTVFVVSIVLLSFGVYFGSIYWSLSELRSAFIDQDIAALQRYVNWDRLRDHVRSEVRRSFLTHMAQEANRKGDKFGAALAAAIGPALVDQFINTMITPEGLVALMRQGPNTSPNRWPTDFSYEGALTTFDQYTLALKGNKRQSPNLKLILEREGLTWRLVKITFGPGEAPWENTMRPGGVVKSPGADRTKAETADLKISVVSNRTGDQMVIDGDIYNGAQAPRNVPRLRVTLRDGNRNALGAKTIEPPVSRLPPGSHAPFKFVFEHATIVAKDAAAAFVFD